MNPSGKFRREVASKLTASAQTAYTYGMTPRFDPGGFFEFNLAQGEVQTRDGDAVVIVGKDMLRALLLGDDSNSERSQEILYSLGQLFAERTKASLASDALAESPETVLGHAASVIALFGWGRLSFEQWGPALVLSLPCQPDDSAFLEPMLSGFMSTLANENVNCLYVSANETDTGKFVVLNPQSAIMLSAKNRGEIGIHELLAQLTNGQQPIATESTP